MTRLAILGPGLLGGSIALAAEQNSGFEVAIWARRVEAVEQLRARGFRVRASNDLGAVVQGADLVVLCVPIGAMPALSREIAPLIRPGAVITDVGSVKTCVVEELGPLLSKVGHFV